MSCSHVDNVIVDVDESTQQRWIRFVRRETCERLWSFMRRFSRMTKEMRPSHRIDILTDALLHFARLTVISLSKEGLVVHLMKVHGVSG